MKIVNQMAAGFCENYRTFDRFSSRAVSLQRLGYDPRGVNRLLNDTKDEWRRANVPDGFREQVYPYPCAAQCQRCQEAYEARRVSRFRRTMTAFAELYAPRGFLEFQTLTVAPFAPKPEYVRDVLHDTPETDRVYQSWLSEYLAYRVQKARDSLQTCAERWRELGRRKCTNPDEEDIWLRRYEDVPIQFPATVLRFLPEDLLSKREVQRVYGIITNNLKSEFRDEAALSRGYPSVADLFNAAPEESHDRLETLLSEIALQRLREVKASGEFSNRVKDWFARADVLTQSKLQSDIGLTGGEVSELLETEIHNAWLHQCWHDGLMQACVDKARVYIPLQTERWVRKDGRFICRQEYGPVSEPSLHPDDPEVVHLSEDCPVYRVPRSVLSEMQGLYRRRVRRAGIQFRYIAVEEAGKDKVSKEALSEHERADLERYGRHYHVHSVLGFETPPEFDLPFPEYRLIMRNAWHAVSGNIIWRRGRWSEPVRRPERVGNYCGKYLSKDTGRQTWISQGLGLQQYNREKRLQEFGLLDEREPKIKRLKHGGFAFDSPYKPEELERVGKSEWVGLTRVKGHEGLAIPTHYRVDAVARATRSPSLGTATGVVCVHRSRGAVNVIPAVDVWLPVNAFYAMCNPNLPAPPIIKKLLVELQVQLNRKSAGHAESQAALNQSEYAKSGRFVGAEPTDLTFAYARHYKRQQARGLSLHRQLWTDFEELAAQCESAVTELLSPRSPPINA